jgi:metal-sulfur cluster biosynthetic enzyme
MTMLSRDQIMQALRQVIDPELGINIVDLGLVYAVDIEDSRVHVRMTVTTPGCPMAFYLIRAAEAAVRDAVPDAENVEVELVWEPPWDPSRLSDAARAQLGWKYRDS